MDASLLVSDILGSNMDPENVECLSTVFSLIEQSLLDDSLICGIQKIR